MRIGLVDVDGHGFPNICCMAMNYTNNGYTLRHALRRMGVMLPDEQRELF